MTKKYIVIPGDVVSKYDNDIHYISAHKLCFLYKVNPKECYFCDESRPETLLGLPKDLIILRPSESGDYDLKKYYSSK